MTTQVDLQKVWALTGGSIDPDIATPGKYENGWVVEIPTYENFNWVLQTHSKNILTLAEQGSHNWQADILYKAGAVVRTSNFRYYTCVTEHTNQNPLTDAVGVYWMLGTAQGDLAAEDALMVRGLHIKDVNPAVSATSWNGNDITIESKLPLIVMNPTVGNNWAIGNVTGVLCAIDMSSYNLPDNGSLALTESWTHRLYHEGNKPTQAEVPGTIPDAPSDGKLYARKNGAWVVVTTTVVSDEPPPPVSGNGAGWFNLVDAQMYVDTNDGTSSQWTPANPPLIPTP